MTLDDWIDPDQLGAEEGMYAGISTLKVPAIKLVAQESGLPE